MNSQQDAPSGCRALRSLIIGIGMAGLLAGCQQPEATTGPEPGTETGALANDKACADIAATADRVFFEYDSPSCGRMPAPPWMHWRRRYRSSRNAAS